MRGVVTLRAILAGATAAFLVVTPFAGSAGIRTALILIAAVALAILGYRESSLARGPLPRALLAALAAWTGVAAASILWSRDPAYTLGELRADVLYPWIAFAVFFFGARFCRWAAWHRWLLTGALLVAAANALAPFLPASLTRHAVDGQGGMWSTYLVMVAPFTLAIGWPGMWKVRRDTVLQVVAFALLFAAAWQSGNRMVWVALGVQAALMMFLSHRAFGTEATRDLRRVLVVGILVVAVAFTLSIKERSTFTNPDASPARALASDVRPQIWSVAWTRFLEAPWLGHGFGREILAPAFQAVKVPAELHHPRILHAHNVFMDMALELGVVGLGAFLAVLYALVRQYRACFRDAGTVSFGILGFALLAGFLVKNLTDDFLHRHNALMFWALNGALLGVIRPAARGTAALPATSAAASAAFAGPTVEFTCNVCGTRNRAVPLPRAENREAASCAGCRSSLRQRSLMYLLSMELYGRPMTLPEFPIDRRIRGLGMSDWEGFAGALAGKLDYVNTFYHQEPRLDIAAIPEAWVGAYRFLISSDVFEHIPPRVLDAAFANSRSLLAPGGCFIFTAPFVREGETREHFPRLNDYRIVEVDGRRRLLNTTVEGVEESFDDLVFHGGEGMTLEMRRFSQDDLLRRLAAAGFSSVRVHGEHFPEYGILWPIDYSLPIVATA